MSLLCVGINHQSAEISLREQLSISDEQQPQALASVRTHPLINEAMIVSTCNRTEVYSTCPNKGILLHWLATYHNVDISLLKQVSYCHTGRDAISHLLRVCCGLHSMVIGEPQILGQVKRAYAHANRQGTAGDCLSQLMPNIFNACKHIRHTTQVGENPVSMAHAIVQIAKQIFTHFNQSNVLLIGAGETIELIAKYFVSHGIDRITLANRSSERARAIAEPIGAQQILIGDIPGALKDSDIVVSATSSPLPILGKGAIETAIKQRKHKPMLLADLAVPRDVEAEVAELKDCYLYNLDDLHSLLQQNLGSRRAAAEQAEALVAERTDVILCEMKIQRAAGVIAQFRYDLEQISQHELARALKQLQQLHDPQEVVQTLVHRLTNKWLHKPTQTLRKAALEEDAQLLQSIEKLFAEGG